MGAAVVVAPAHGRGHGHGCSVVLAPEATSVSASAFASMASTKVFATPWKRPPAIMATRSSVKTACRAMSDGYYVTW